MYLPLQMGAAKAVAEGKNRFATGDDMGTNISDKNPLYSELTGLYYARYNLFEDYLGLVHYRRYFGKHKMMHKHGDWRDNVLTTAIAEDIFKNSDVIVPTKRRYFVLTLYSHYSKTHDAAHLELTKQIVSRRYPNYMAHLDGVYSRTWGYMFNMCIMKRDLLIRYCDWLFPILEELETMIDTERMDAFNKRLYGRVSEILFNVWIDYMIEHENLRISELPVISPEPINWAKKLNNFFNALFLGEKYKESV